MTFAEGDLERRLERLETRLTGLEEAIRADRMDEARRQRAARRARIMLWVVVAAAYLGYLWYASNLV